MANDGVRSLLEVPAGAREVLRPLFADCPGLKGVVAASLSGEMGTALADDLASPQVALLHLDFYIVGGKPDREGFEKILHGLPMAGMLIVPASWLKPLEERCPGNLTPHRRVEFDAGDWDLRTLKGLIEA